MTGAGRGYCAIAWKSAHPTLQRSFDGSRPRPNQAPGGPESQIPDVGALRDAIERLAERVDALSARLKSQQRGDA